jgi:hypothetical protein
MARPGRGVRPQAAGRQTLQKRALGLLRNPGWRAAATTAAALVLALIAGFGGILTEVPMAWIALRVWVDIVLLVAIYLGIPSQRRWVHTLPPGALTLLHVWRVVPGCSFLALYWDGTLPWHFALVAGTGELAVGLTAPLAGYGLGAVTRRRRIWLAAWHILGLVELLAVMGLGIGLHQAGKALLESMSHFPLFLLPLFAVPLTIGAHIVTAVAVWPRTRAI